MTESTHSHIPKLITTDHTKERLPYLGSLLTIQLNYQMFPCMPIQLGKLPFPAWHEPHPDVSQNTPPKVRISHFQWCSQAYVLSMMLNFQNYSSLTKHPSLLENKTTTKKRQHPHTILQHITCLKFLGTVSFCWARKISQLEPYTNLSLHKLWGSTVHKRLQSTPSIHALVKIKDIQIIALDVHHDQGSSIMSRFQVIWVEKLKASEIVPFHTPAASTRKAFSQT